MKKDMNYYMNLPYEIIIKKLSDEDGGGYFARYKDFPYIMGDGDTEILALEDVKSAFSGALEVMIQHNDYIKEPQNDEAKIRVNITLPKSLLDRIDKVTNNRSAFLAQCANANLS